MAGHLDNQILARLDKASFALIEPELTVVHFEGGHVLSETQSEIQKVYFPQTGIISCVVELIGGGAIETGMIGRDGQFGAALALDHKLSLNHVVMQVPGDVSVMSSDRFRQLVEQHPSLRSAALAYDLFSLAQSQQTAACNATHHVEARTCKWLLRMHHLVGDDLPLTQEFLAQMMGVRRSTVTQIAGDLQRAGMITFTRGRVRITNLNKIRFRACECNETLVSHYARMFN